MQKDAIIIEAAIRVFARDGLEKGKIADIAKEAGIGKGTVYEYFSSKEDLFLAIEEHITGGLLLIVDEAMSQQVTAQQKLRSIFTISVNHLQEMNDELLIVTELLVQGARGHLFHGDNKTLSGMYASFREKVESILNEGMINGEFREMNAPGVATLFLAFIDGIIWQYIFVNDSEQFSILLNEAVESFMKGILL